MARARTVPAVPPDPTWEALRDTAVADLDVLIEAASAARSDLRLFQTALEKTRRHLAHGGRASEVTKMFDVPTVRTSMSDRLDRVERARAAARRSLWRLQAWEGTTLAEIARVWGLSRQLVSRALTGGDSQPSGRR